MCIITTDETFENIEYKDDDGNTVIGSVNRFFASPREIKAFFVSEEVLQDVNTNGTKIKTQIQLENFSPEDIARSPKLKGKSHYVFVTKTTQGKL